MALPDFDGDGFLPRGIHAAKLSEVIQRYGVGSSARQEQAELSRQVVEAAKSYPTIKRVLVWGSFVTDKPEPNDLDYSIVVSIDHHDGLVSAAHRRFFVPLDARIYYEVDRSFLVIWDYPPEDYAGSIIFFCHSRTGHECGIVEINV